MSRFDYFWKECRSIWKLSGRLPGSKIEAQRQYDKMSLSDEQVEDILTAAAEQALAIQRSNAGGPFTANLKDVCRYLKYQCWEDWEDEADKGFDGPGCSTQERIAQRIRELDSRAC